MRVRGDDMVFLCITWISPLQLPDAKANMYTVFSVNNFNEAVSKGLNGPFLSMFNTKVKLHFGAGFLLNMLVCLKFFSMADISMLLLRSRVDACFSVFAMADL